MRVRACVQTSTDDSVSFDISSFHAHAKSLILTGDLKFQVFRGNLAAPAGGKIQHTADAEEEDGAEASVDDDGGKGDEEKPSVYCWFWVNTSFMSHQATSMVLRKEQLDEIQKDAKVDPEMNLALEYHCPPRAASWAHAPHPTFHLVPSAQPLSPLSPKSTAIDEDDDPNE